MVKTKIEIKLKKSEMSHQHQTTSQTITHIHGNCLLKLVRLNQATQKCINQNPSSSNRNPKNNETKELNLRGWTIENIEMEIQTEAKNRTLGSQICKS